MSLTKDKLIFDPADTADSDNIGAYLRAGSDGDLLSSTNVGGKEGLDVNLITASIAVTATDLDIRNISQTQDSILVFGYDGAANKPFKLAVDGAVQVGDNGGSLTVDSTDLDIRDLSHSQDSVKIGDGTDFLAVNADGSINVLATVTSASHYAEDSAHVSGATGSFSLAVRNDAETSLVSANGDYAPFQVDATGRLKVQADLDVVSSFEKIEDSAHASGDIGAYILGVRQDALASSTSADGDYGSIKTDARGAAWVAPIGTAADDAVDTEAPVKVGSRAVSGALAVVSTSGDRADLRSDMYRRIWINDSPNIGVSTQAMTVNTTESAFPAALGGRRRMMIQNTSNNAVYVGPSGLDTTIGLKIEKGATLSLEIGENVNLFAIAGSNTNVIRVFELA